MRRKIINIAIVSCLTLCIVNTYMYFNHFTPVNKAIEGECKSNHGVCLAQKDASTISGIEGQGQQRSSQTKLEDIFISIKTTARFYENRLKVIIKTWLQDAINQTYVITDAEDLELQKELPANHVVVTNCSTKHERQGLTCKLMHEFYTYYKVEKRWFCHLDDDIYLNVPNLLALLQQYSHEEDWYFGKLSINRLKVVKNKLTFPETSIQFRFGTGGAGFCISRALAHKMMPFVANGQLVVLANRFQVNDDVVVGCIIDGLLHTNLTVVRQLHSHIERLAGIPQNDFNKAITLSYHQNRNGWNRIKIEGFSLEEDPTRFLSVRCFLRPHLPMCIDLKQ